MKHNRSNRERERDSKKDLIKSEKEKISRENPIDNSINARYIPNNTPHPSIIEN